MSQLTFGSLFSGIGGFDLGFERASMVCKWQVEIDDYCNKVLAKHWPNVERWNDVRTFPVAGPRWNVDVICGGFPCKQTSLAASISGKRSGLAGVDSGLWYEMLRVVRQLGPAFVVVENVAGASKWNHEIKAGLEDSGYQVPEHPVRLSAEFFGAPHRRKRLFWIADLNGTGLQIARQAESFAADCEARRAVAGNLWGPANARGLRVADGVPGGVDRASRIEACGNSLVPACSEWIGRRIVEAATSSPPVTRTKTH